MAESKSRLLYILQYLWLKTDAEHYATTGDILTYLRENDIRCDRVKSFNEQIYYLVDNINTAINHGKQISFRYFHFDQHRKEVPNNGGKRYHFSPYFAQESVTGTG